MANRVQERLKFVEGVYGDNWRKLRESEGKSVREFQKTIPMSFSSISKIENEITPPTIAQINLYQEHFHCSLDYLTGHTTVKDVELSKMSEFTGLTENSLINLNLLSKCKSEKPKYTFVDDKYFDIPRCVNHFFSDIAIFKFFTMMNNVMCEKDILENRKKKFIEYLQKYEIPQKNDLMSQAAELHLKYGANDPINPATLLVEQNDSVEFSIFKLQKFFLSIIDKL